MITPSILLVHLLPGLLAQAAPTVPPDPFDFWPLVTPLLGVSPSCFEASMEYANGILNGSSWAIQMLDSSGHLPFLQEGQLSDTRPLYICGIFDALLGPGACPPSLQDYPLMIPFGHAVDLGDQDLCTTVTEVTTHFCHNGLNAFPLEATVRNAKEFRPHAPQQHRFHTLDGEHILRVRQQVLWWFLRTTCLAHRYSDVFRNSLFHHPSFLRDVIGSDQHIGMLSAPCFVSGVPLRACKHASSYYVHSPVAGKGMLESIFF